MADSILIVSMPYEFSRGGHNPFMPDVAVLSLVTYLRDRHIDAYGYIARGTGPSACSHMYATVCDLVSRLSISSVGLSVNYLPGVVAANGLIAALRAVHTHLRVIVGGSAASGLARAGMVQHTLPGADVYVIGDGERILLDLLTHSSRGNTQSGASAVIGCELPADDIPPLCFPHVFTTDIYGHVQSLLDVCCTEPYHLEIVNSRGCPYSCPFCISPHMGRFRISRIEALLRTVNQARAARVTSFTYDNTHFNLPSDGLHERMLALGQLGIPFDAEARVDCLTEGDVREFSSAGGRLLYFGIESLATDVQRGLYKTLDTLKLERCADICHENGVRIVANLLIGLPGATERTDRDTIRRAFALCERRVWDLLSIGVFVPLPGTAFWESGLYRIIDTDFYHWDADHAVCDIISRNETYRHTTIQEIYEDALTSPWVQTGLKPGALAMDTTR